MSDGRVLDRARSKPFEESATFLRNEESNDALNPGPKRQPFRSHLLQDWLQHNVTDGFGESGIADPRRNPTISRRRSAPTSSHDLTDSVSLVSQAQGHASRC